MKPWYHSLTLWFNLVTFLVAIAPAVAVFIKTLDPTAAVTVDAVVALVNVIGNYIIRIFFTSTAIGTPLKQ